MFRVEWVSEGEDERVNSVWVLGFIGLLEEYILVGDLRENISSLNMSGNCRDWEWLEWGLVGYFRWLDMKC